MCLDDLFYLLSKLPLSFEENNATIRKEILDVFVVSCLCVEDSGICWVNLSGKDEGI